MAIFNSGKKINFQMKYSIKVTWPPYIIYRVAGGVILSFQPLSWLLDLISSTPVSAVHWSFYQRRIKSEVSPVALKIPTHPMRSKENALGLVEYRGLLATLAFYKDFQGNLAIQVLQRFTVDLPKVEKVLFLSIVVPVFKIFLKNKILVGRPGDRVVSASTHSA